MATYEIAIRHRKNAVERYRYYRRKNGIMDTYDTSSHIIPTVEKGMESDYYDYMVDLFDSFSPEDLQEIIKEQYFEPKDETAPFDVSFSEEYSDRLHKLDYLIGDEFEAMIDYVYDYSGLSEIDIEDLLSQCESYISHIEGIYAGYISDRPTASTVQQSNNMYWAARKTLSKMGREVFGIDTKE